MKDILNLDSANVNDFLDNVFCGCKVPVNINDIDALGNGSVDDVDGKLLGLNIGVGGLYYDNDKVHDLDYVYLVVECYHELHHVKQFENMQNNVNESNVTDCISYFANRSNNPFYYHHNYFRNINEIEAEYVGINNAYVYLSALYDSDIAEKLVVNYVNDKSYSVFSREPRYFVDSSFFKKFTSLSGINNALDDVYESSKNTKRIYDKDVYGRDEVMTYMLSDDCKDIYAKFDAETDGSKQNMMVASIVNHLHPDMVHNYKAFDDFVDISSETVFGKELSEDFSDDVKAICGQGWCEARTDYMIDEINAKNRSKRMLDLESKFGDITEHNSDICDFEK